MIGRRTMLGLLGMAPMAPSLARSIDVPPTPHYMGVGSTDYGNVKEASPISEKEYLNNELKQIKEFFSNILENEDEFLKNNIAMNIRHLMNYGQPQIDWDIRNMKSISDVGKIQMQAVRMAKRELEERKKDYTSRIESITRQLLAL